MIWSKPQYLLEVFKSLFIFILEDMSSKMLQHPSCEVKYNNLKKFFVNSSKHRTKMLLTKKSITNIDFTNENRNEIEIVGVTFHHVYIHAFFPSG